MSLLNPNTHADLYHFEILQLLRHCHMKTHKSKGEKLLAAAPPQQSLIFKCLFYWAQSSYKMKSCFFDEREIGFPRMLCPVGKAEHQLSWGFGKHVTFHHGNLWKCGVSMKLLSPPGQVDQQVLSQQATGPGVEDSFTRKGQMSSRPNSSCLWITTCG